MVVRLSNKEDTMAKKTAKAKPAKKTTKKGKC